MARQRLESLFNEFKHSVNLRIDRLSKQVKIYGAVVTLGAVAIPVYGQVKSLYAQEAIEKAVDVRIERAVTKAADASAERARLQIEQLLKEQHEQASTRD